MSKPVKSKKVIKKKVRQDWPLVVYVWIIGLGFMSYLVARIALAAYPHPVHWASGIIGAIIGYFVGRLWFRWRGDIL